MVGRACKLAGGLLPGVNKLPGRETAEEVYKLGVAVVFSANGATDGALYVALPCGENGETWDCAPY
jgi:hypothetical protein